MVSMVIQVLTSLLCVLGLFWAGPGLMSIHNTDLGAAPVKLSSLHDFFYTLQLSDALFHGSSGQKDGVLSEF